ncbi:gamma-glutamylcyclotransferase [Alteromonas flava]|uniref:gamma-glutamylcyclotransferase n=1 Tax=Alteromonas flava TaxID=2048003 RepID=UPI000F5F418C|nr:gamma-glutamylcyclotransferase [Alteromonas flava]
MLSADSRLNHSDHGHEALAVEVAGFAREWITRAFHEQQTYVGAVLDNNATLNALCTPIALNPKLRDRERDYRFTVVEPSQITLLEEDDDGLFINVKRPGVTLWICESLQCLPAQPDYPINLSYVDTCLAGCLTHFATAQQGRAAATTFIQTTAGWQHVVDDRINPQYPRRAEVSSAQQRVISELLAQADIEISYAK